MGISDKEVAKNVFWRYLERFLANGMTFAVSLVLARILDPDEYGTVALVTVIIAIFEIFATRGFVQALVQKNEITEIDYSTIFYTNFLIEVLLYVILFFSAPGIARFFKNISPLILRVLGIRLFICSFNSVQQAFVQRNMQFKKFFYSTSIGTAVSGIGGIVMALHGFGVWALVFQSLANPAIDTLVLFITVDWKPKLQYSFESIKSMWSYGLRMLGSAFLESIYNEIRSLTIGKRYTSSDLAYYNKGQNLSSMVFTNLQVSASNVFFAALSRETSIDATKKKMREYLRIVFYVVSPVLVGLALVAKPLISVLYTDKWLPAVPFLIIYCFSYLTWVPQMTWLQAMNARGYAGTTLKLMIVHRIIGIILIILALNYGPIYIAYTALLADCNISLLIYLSVRKIFNYSIREFWEDTGKTVVVTLIMSAIVLLSKKIYSTNFVCLAMSCILGVASYICASWLFKPEGFLRITTFLKNKLKKNT